MVSDQSLFFSLTHLPNQGAPFEGTIVDDARRMFCNDQAEMTGRLLARSLTFSLAYLHSTLARITSLILRP